MKYFLAVAMLFALVVTALLLVRFGLGNDAMSEAYGLELAGLGMVTLVAWSSVVALFVRNRKNR